MKKKLTITLAIMLSLMAFSSCSKTETLSEEEGKKLLSNNNKVAKELSDCFISTFKDRVADGTIEDLNLEEQQYSFSLNLDLTDSEDSTSDMQELLEICSAYCCEGYGVSEGEILVFITDDSTYVEKVYFSDSQDSEYTGCYPDSPKDAPTYKISDKNS